MSLQKMSLGGKLGWGFGLILTALGAVVVLGVVRLEGASEAIADVADVHVPLMEAVATIDVTATEQELAATLTAIHTVEREDLIAEFAELDREVDRQISVARELIGRDAELVQRGWVKSIDEIATRHDAFVTAAHVLLESTATGDREAIEEAGDGVMAASARLMEVVDAFLETNEQEMGAVASHAVDSAGDAKILLTTIGLGAIAAGAVLAVLITRSITRPVNRIIVSLNEGANQVNDASAQVAGASQQLAEGASEQASSLEETSSALEQMAAMTRTNAENSKRANALSDQAKTAAQEGDRIMGQLNESMDAINESSGQISKIIKVIEEIAFQTNLLALNAAVEAARAGEHGKGFAVVADEVRNLAQRAAQASREITGLIEDSVNKAKEGTDVAGEVGKVLGAIVGDVTEVAALISGISKASEEQAQGVDQVNTAVSQMDKVTQQNASGAEQSTAAAEELSAQSQAVKGMVGELLALVEGAGDDTAQSTRAAKPTSSTVRSRRGPARTPAKPRANPQPSIVARKAADINGVSPEEFMALDDHDGLKEF